MKKYTWGENFKKWIYIYVMTQKNLKTVDKVPEPL